MEVRLADGRVARCLQHCHRSGGVGRDVLGEHGRAVRRPDAGGVEQILDGEPHARGCGRELGDEDPGLDGFSQRSADATGTLPPGSGVTV